MSSTQDDLVQERAVAHQVIDRLCEVEFVGMERFGARPSSPIEASLVEIDSADVYICILGTRHGEVTRLEFERAGERNIPCYFFLKNCSEREEELERWTREILDKRSGWIVEHFTSPDQLATALAAVLANHVIADWTAAELIAAVERGDAERIPSLVRAMPATDVVRHLLARRGVHINADVAVELTRRARGRVADADPKMMRASVDNFVHSYLGRPDDPIPFGGRAAELARLHRWARNDSGPAYLLVAEEAGRGKSALLVHFAQELRDDPAIHVIFFPISVRFGLNLAAVVFPALATQLAAAHDAPLPTHMNAPVKAWQELTLDYLSRPFPGGRKLVVILDGLDEAADWSAEPGLFPADAPPNLRILASARFVADASSAAEWRRLLGWESSYVAESIGVDPLGPDQLRDVIVRMGVPVAELASRPEIIEQLQRLTNGDPLLISLYVRELWSKGGTLPCLRAGDLESMTPGFTGFFKRWWQEQLKLWGSDAPLLQKCTRRLLSIFCMTFGRLRRDDLLTLLADEQDASGLTLDLMLKPLRRFVVGDSNGYTFNHPLYARYMREEMLQPAERQRYEAELIAWGQSVAGALDKGTLHPTGAPPYVVQYLSTHLRRAGAPADDLLRLLTPAWRNAWEVAGGGLSGFAADVARAREALSNDAGRLADEVYCAALLASVRSLAQNLPASLLLRLVEEGRWTRAAALAYVRAMIDSRKKAEALVIIGRLFDGAERAAIDVEAVEIERRDRSKTSLISFDVLLGCANLPIERIVETLGETNDDGKRACFRRLADDGRWPEIVTIAEQFHAYGRTNLLMIAATAMLEHGRAHEAYPLLSAIEDNQWLSDDLLLNLILAALDTTLPRLAPVLIQRWPNANLTIRRHLPRIADLLEAIEAGRIPPPRTDDVTWVAMLVGYVRFTESPAIPRVLARLRPCLESGLAAGIMRRLRVTEQWFFAEPLMAFADDYDRKEILRRFTAPPEQKVLIACAAFIPREDLPIIGELLKGSVDFIAALVAAGRSQEAQQLAESWSDDENRVDSLAELLPKLSDSQRSEVTGAILDELDSDAMMFDYARERLEELIPSLAPHQLERAISIARRIDDRIAQHAVRIGMRAALPSNEREEWLRDTIEYPYDYSAYTAVTGLLLPYGVVAEVASWIALTEDDFEPLAHDVLFMLRDLPDKVAAAPLVHVVARIGLDSIDLRTFGRPLPAQLATVIPDAAMMKLWRYDNAGGRFPTCIWFVDPADRPGIARTTFAHGLSRSDEAGEQRDLIPFLPREHVQRHFLRTMEMFPAAFENLHHEAECELVAAIGILSPAVEPEELIEFIKHIRNLTPEARISAALQMLPFAKGKQRQVLRELLAQETPEEFHATLVAKFGDYTADDLPQRTIVEAIVQASIPVSPVLLSRAAQELPTPVTTLVLAYCQPLLANEPLETLRDMIGVITEPHRSCLRDRLLFDIAALRPSIATVYGPAMPARVLEAIERACRVFP